MLISFFSAFAGIQFKKEHVYGLCANNSGQSNNQIY